MAEPDFAPFELRPYAAEHRAGVIELLRAVYAEYGQIVELDTLDADLLRLDEVYTAPSVLAVLVGDGEVLGTVGVKWTAADCAELKRVFLDRRLRGRGLGRRLVEWAVDRARIDGAHELDVWSDVLFEDAHRLYLRMGARDTAETRRLGGRNDVVERHFRLDTGLR